MVKRLITIAVLATLLVGCVLSVSKPTARGATMRKQQMEQMLLPTTRVNVGEGGGSGTLIFSKRDEEGKVLSLVLTNYHVIAKTMKKDTHYEITVDFFDYKDGRIIGDVQRKAVVIAWNKTVDLALLMLLDDETVFPHVAYIAPPDTLKPFDVVYGVGAGVGDEPFPTYGLVGNIDFHMEGQKYILSSAQIVNGDSGGGLYHWSKERQRYEIVGVPSAVRTYHRYPVWHMALAVPCDTVRDFLLDSKAGFVFTLR